MKEWLIIHPVVRDDNDILTFFGVDDYLNEGRDREGGWSGAYVCPFMCTSRSHAELSEVNHSKV